MANRIVLNETSYHGAGAIKEIVTENGRNTSWLSSKFENFKGQHEIVDLMVREQLKSMSN